MNPNQCHVTQMEKGKIYTGRVIRVSEQRVYQDKFLRKVIIREPNDSDLQGEVKPRDLVAEEIANQDQSPMLEKLGEVVSYVFISPGDNTPNRPPWIKLDQPMAPRSELELRDKLYIARDSYKMVTELIVGGKLDAKKADGMAENIAKKIIELSKKL